nr:tetratricopeptide repeat protein [Saccharothrix algeriensis]
MDEAWRRHAAALALATDLGVPDSTAAALTALGSTRAALGRRAEAVDHHRRALEPARDIGDRETEAPAHCGLSELGEDPGRHRAEALRPAEELADHAIGVRARALLPG